MRKCCYDEYDEYDYEDNYKELYEELKKENEELKRKLIPRKSGNVEILLNNKDVSLDIKKITVRNNIGTSLSSTQLKSMITIKEYEIEYENGDKEIIEVEIINGKEQLKDKDDEESAINSFHRSVYKELYVWYRKNEDALNQEAKTEFESILYNSIPKPHNFDLIRNKVDELIKVDVTEEEATEGLPF